MAVDASVNTKNYTGQGGADTHISGTLDIETGGKVTVKSGATLQVDAGATLSLQDASYAPDIIALADNHILVGDAGGDAVDVAMSGDATIIDTGAVTVVGLNGAATALTGTEANQLHTVTAGAVPVLNKVQVFDASLNHRRTNAVVAAAGANQGNAAALTADLNAITGADGTKGVVLPTAVAGDGILIINTDAANTLKVYPATGAAINAIAANSPFVIGAGRAAIFEATSATQWYTDQLSAATPTAAETNTLAGVVAGIVSASKALVVDAALALSGLLIKLGNAVTVQSPPVAGIAPDLTVNVAGTTQSQFYTLNTVTIPANAMSANGKGIQFTFLGILAANANNKDFRLGFGAGTTTLATAQAGNAVSYYCTGVIYRTSAGNQILVAEITIGNAAPFPVCVALTQDETTALALTLQSQNTAAAASSATGKGAVVWFSN